MLSCSSARGLDPGAAREATVHVFSVRDTHPIPEEIPDPPQFWHVDYSAFPEELGLTETTLDEAMKTVRMFWAKVSEETE